MASAGDEMSSDDIVSIPADVTQPDDVEQMFTWIETRFSRLDVLFNNAGTSVPPTTFESIDPEQWTRCIATNLTGSFLCARAAYALMKRQHPKGGRIINNGSVSAHMPRPNSAPYTVSKHAITGLTRSISLDGRADNIVCSQIDIGNADTSMAGKFKTGIIQASGQTRTEPVMDVVHCGEAIAFIAALPLSANVQFMTLMASHMPYIGRG